jgi:TolB-like protein/Flp pilus assembly protein TadD
MPVSSELIYRFGDYELNARAYELRRAGETIRLERRPMDLLLILLERRGELVPRADIVGRLWEKDVFVDVDLGLNTAIRKVRQALGDDRSAPKFVETISGRGYRFIASVTVDAPAPYESRRRKTLAVLPFENLGGDPEREYLADGLTEEAIAAIGLIDPEQLAVIGRTSINRYKQNSKTLAEIGKELNAAYLLEGSVRGEGGRLRITARLVTSDDQVQVWSASYDSEPSSVLGMQRELSKAIAEQVRMKLLPERMTTLVLRQTQNVEAYDLYLRGRYLWNQLKPATTKQAIEFYRHATELDPGYALAWSGMADAYSSSPINGDAEPQKVSQLAQQAADHAMSCASDLAESQTSLGFVNLFLNWDWPLAEASFRRATQLAANNPLGHRMLGVVLSHSGKQEEAMLAMKRARELDPLYAMHQALSSMIACHAGDYDLAVDFGRQATVVDPQFWVGYYHLARAYTQMGRVEPALEALRAGEKFGAGNSKVFALRGYLLAKNGQGEGAREVLDVLDVMERGRYVPPYTRALIHLGLGEIDMAFEFLAKAYAVRDVHLIFLPVDPQWTLYRSDPRYTRVLSQCDFQRTSRASAD